MNDRPRLLLIGTTPLLEGLLPDASVEMVSADPTEVARRLFDEQFAAVIASPELVSGLFDQFCRDEFIIEHIDKGLAVLDTAGTVTWANAVFRDWCGRNPVGQPFLEALGAVTVSAESTPGSSRLESPAAILSFALQGHPISLRFTRSDNESKTYLQADLRTVLNADGSASRLIAMIRDITPEVVQQQKLDALHTAGRELAGLDLTDMDMQDRVELLKANLRNSIHNLLHYDTIEVRVLDRRTGQLKPLLEDGMTEAAANRPLYARPTGNGVTGYVAYSGRSYLCPDTDADSLYIPGAEGAKSSMTVALKVQEEVIGTLNVESPRTNGFGPHDLQFTELFSREIAAALNTLNLLTAQEKCTASQSIERVNKEIALPIDEVLAGASVLLKGAEANSPVAARLRQILDSARRVKESVANVGRDYAPIPLPAPNGSAAIADSEHAAFSPDDPTPLVGKAVLVIDADERVRRQAHLLMSRLGARVETAGTAGDGIALAADTAYDAIFMDMKPVDMGGYDSYCRLREARPDSTVAMTTGFGYDVAHSIVKARQAGMKYVLFKPFRQDQVVKAVLDPIPAAPAICARPEGSGTS